MRHFLCVILILWSGALCAQEANEKLPDERERAEMLYQSAVQLFGEGRYKESLQAFDKAIDLVPDSLFFCNRAVVHIELGDAPKGLSDLQTCQSTFSGSKEELAQIDAQATAVDIGVNNLISNARGTTDGIQRAILESQTKTKFGLRGWGLVTLAVGGGAIGSAIVFDLLSADLVERFVEESEGRDGTNVQEFNDLKKSVQTRQTIFYALAISGAVLSATGLTMIVLGGGKERPEGTQAKITIGPNQVGVYGEF